jgi:ribosomal-protein-alanine N-acetyltransferase
MKHKGTVVLKTQRLILRPFKETDTDVMFQNWARHDNVTRYMEWPTHVSVDVTKAVIASWIEQYSNPQCYQWCIEYKDNHQAIGSISVVALNEAVEAVEIGYCIGEDYWFKGITAEAFQSVIKFMFEEVACNRIFARHDANNPNSGKVMTKCALQYEGTQRQAGKNNTGICDVAVYAILKEDYLNK